MPIVDMQIHLHLFIWILTFFSDKLSFALGFSERLICHGLTKFLSSIN